MGHSFWRQYTAFSYDTDITTLLLEYTPTNVFKVSVLWVLWVKWCEWFYKLPEGTDEYELTELWTPDAMVRLRKELTSRILEAPAVAQWLDIVQDRRLDDNRREMAEKEFLLTASRQIAY